MTSQQSSLKHYGLIIFVVDSFDIQDFHLREDCIQSGFLALMRALERFDSTKGKFTTYASKCIKNEVIRYLQKHNKFPIIKDLQ